MAMNIDRSDCLQMKIPCTKRKEKIEIPNIDFHMNEFVKSKTTYSYRSSMVYSMLSPNYDSVG